MKTNMGLADRIIRIIIAALLGILYFTNVITGTLGIILLLAGIYFLITSFLSFCPLYMPIKLNTKSKK